MKITLISFGNKAFEPSKVRLYEDAKNTGLFDNIYISGEKELKKDTKFFQDHASILSDKFPGFGGWVWKTYLIESAFKKFPDSDFFVYIDCGSEFNINERSKKRFNDYLDISDEESVLAFRNRDPEYRLSHCSVIENIFPQGRSSNQFNSGLIFLKNNKESLDIIKEWKKYCIEDNYKNLFFDEQERCCNNLSIHLPDQSVFSLIMKKNYKDGILDESDWYLPSTTVSRNFYENAYKYPIFHARNIFDHKIAGQCLNYKNFKICVCPNTMFCSRSITVR